jgi:hypothetical protein
MRCDPKVADTVAIAYQEFLGIGKFHPAMKPDVYVGCVNDEMGEGSRLDVIRICAAPIP